MGQKFTYTKLVFGSISFKLFNLGQTFQVVFHKLLAHSSCQSWCNGVRVVGLARTHFFSSAHKYSIGLRSGLCDGHSKTFTLLSLSHFASTLCMLGVNVHLEDPFATKF